MRLEFTYTPRDLQEMLNHDVANRWNRTATVRGFLILCFAGALIAMVKIIASVRSAAGDPQAKPAEKFIVVIPWVLLLGFLALVLHRRLYRLGIVSFKRAPSLHAPRVVQNR
jgi:hypothetical protein